mmetsp:Transcript_20281/g.51346  ORF Transcript_20281/g.51346 Transcript_20281/m.51346 type:complete len:956 (+) Transcript_20281:150-3017(+)
MHSHLLTQQPCTHPCLQPQPASTQPQPSHARPCSLAAVRRTRTHRARAAGRQRLGGAGSPEADGHERHVQVLALLVLARHHDVKVAAPLGDLLLGHGDHQLAHLLAQPLLVLGEDVVVQQRGAARDRVRGEPLLLEPVQHLLHREVALQDPAVPQRPRHVAELERLGRDGLRHGEQRQREVGKGVAVRLHRLGLHRLVQLQAHQAGGARGGGGDGGDDAARDELGLELVHLGDRVVARAHVGQARDQVHVEVGVVILLKLDGRQAVAVLERGARALELLDQRVDHRLVVAVRGHGGRLALGLSGLGVCLDVHALLGHKGRHGHLGRHLGHLVRVCRPVGAGDAVHLGAQDGARLHKSGVRLVARLKVKRVREALGRGPEGRARAGGRVLWEGVHQLRDAAVEVVLELVARPRNALLKAVRALRHQDLHHLLQLLARRRVRRVLHRGHVLGGVRQVAVGLAGALLQQALKLGARPGQAVVNVVREGVHGAHGRLLLGRVARRAVVLGQARDDHLRVALGAQRARLQQRLAKVHAARVHVQARVDVVQRVHHQAQPLPELVVEHALGLGRHAVLQRVDAYPGVQTLRGLRRHGGLGAANVPVAEQELARQVGLLNRVVVRHRDAAPLSAAVGAADAHHGEVLEELAAQRARAYQEHVQARQRGLQRAAKHRNVRVVPGACGRKLLGGQLVQVGQRLHRVKVEPLEHGVELARHRLHHLLAHHAAKHGGDGVHLAARAVRQRAHHALVQLRTRRLRHGGVDVARQRQHALRVLLVRGARRVALLRLKRVQRLEAHVQLRRAVKLGVVRHEELARLAQRRGQRLELERLVLLELRDDAAALVLAHGRRVQVQLEGVRLAVLDADGLVRVERVHAHHLAKGHQLAVLELQPLILHARDHGGVASADGGHDARVGLLTIHIDDGEVGAKVREHACKHAASLGPDEGNAICVAVGIDSLCLL